MGTMTGRERMEAIFDGGADRWGFWHVGDFARDYERRFGRLPSTKRK